MVALGWVEGGGCVATCTLLPLDIGATVILKPCSHRHHRHHQHHQQIPWAHATFSTKERSHCAIVVAPSDALRPGVPGAATQAAPNHSGGGGSNSGTAAAAATTFVAEPTAFYQLPSGGWWLEGHRFLSARDLRALAKRRGGGGERLRLPSDYCADEELVRSASVIHVPVDHIKGSIKLTRVRKQSGGTSGAAGIRARGGFWWRFDFDEGALSVVSSSSSAAAGGGGSTSGVW